MSVLHEMLSSLERVSEEAYLKRVQKHQTSIENVQKMWSRDGLNKRAEECCRKSSRQVFDKRVEEAYSRNVRYNRVEETFKEPCRRHVQKVYVLEMLKSSKCWRKRVHMRRVHDMFKEGVDEAF